jgi:alpha-galactosidase
MVHTLENAFLQLKIDPITARWSLTSRQHNGAMVENAQINIQYHRRWSSHQALDRWMSPHFSKPEKEDSPQGPLQLLHITQDPKQDGMSYRITFALPDEQPFLMWKINVENLGTHSIYIDRIEMLSVGFVYKSRSGPRGTLELSPSSGIERVDGRTKRTYHSPVELAFYSNGWQSWSYSGVYGMDDGFKRTHLGPFTSPLRVNAGTPQPKRPGLFASDMFGVLGDRGHRSALLAGFLSQEQHFGSLEAWIGDRTPALRMWANGDGARLDPGEQISTDWACLYFFHLDNPDPLGPYLEAVATQHGLTPELIEKNIPVGWCSWYQFFQKITPGIIQDNLRSAQSLQPELPLDLMQIDDGYESQVGDWLSFKPDFPEGLAPLAQEIKDTGFTPGVWLAPFIVQPNAQLRKDHPEWILHNRWGFPVNAGFIWDRFTTALDLTHPEAMAHACEVVRTAVDQWGFPYLKLDFLYAGALPGRHHDPTKTRAQILRSALQAIREAAGETITLVGCGCPIGSGIGILDAMRIGPDVDPQWEPKYKGIGMMFKGEPDMPSARNAIHNTLTRASFNHRWWINDPDCLLLRPATHLTLNEVRCLATAIALTGGSLLLSDHLPELPPERLSIAEALLPVIGKRPHVLDWFDNPTPTHLQLDLNGPAGPWHLLGLFNWEPSEKDLQVELTDFYLDPQVEYFMREFWSGDIYQVRDSQLKLNTIPAHGAAILAVRPLQPYHPQYLGSDLHISQGLEVSKWESAEDDLLIQLSRPGKANGKIELGLPRQPTEALLNNRSISWENDGNNRFILPVEFEQTCEIRLRY